MVEGIKVSVIIPTYNRAPELLETLASLGQQTLPPEQFEVIIVDDGSTDGTSKLVASYRPAYSCQLLTQGNRGAAASRNQGASRAAGNILLFLDADMLTDRDLLAQHLQSHQSAEHRIVVGRRDLLTDRGPLGIAGLLHHDAAGVDCRVNSSSVTFMDALSCNLSLRSSDWQALGGFDEQFPPGSGFEDIELAYRATLIGVQTVFNPEAIAYHNHPISSTRRFRQTKSYYRTAPLLIKKHPELRGQLAPFRDKEPINWRADHIRLIGRKLARQLLAWKPALWAIESLVLFLEHRCRSRRLLRFLAWKVVASCQLIGFREGVRQYGW